MMERKKRLRLIQLSLLILGFLIIFFTYLNKNEFSEEKIVTTEKQEKIKRQLANQSQDGEVFYNIEYSGSCSNANLLAYPHILAHSDPSSDPIIFFFIPHIIFLLHSAHGTRPFDIYI